ncbi:MAG: sulfatase-like hydrolase/transferase [Pseudomonadota bacterium]
MRVPLLPLLLSACAPLPAPPEPPGPGGPDVLLVTLDTLRADRVGAYGDPLAATPRLDDLAAHGALFREAISPVPLTLPAHASILTGTYPATHGLRDNGGFRLRDEVPTLAERLGAAGYRTGAFVSAYVLDAAWGLDRGFDTYRAPFNPQDVAAAGAFGELELPGADTVNAALAFLRAAEGQPTFTWVHLYDPHTPWADHPGWQGDPYRGEVAFDDALVGRLLDAMDPAALIVVVADHGEGLWDHGEREHGLLVHRATTRVPLIVRPPGGIEGPLQEPEPRPGMGEATRRPAGLDPRLDLAPVPDAPRAARVVEEPVSSVDLAATIADYLGLTPWGEGRSLRPAVEGRPLPEVPVYTETFFPRFHYGWSELSAVQEGRERLRVGPTLEVYDLAADPGEAHPQQVDEHRLLAVARAHGGEGTPQPGALDVATQERLAALGYVAPLTPPEGARDALPDPRDRTDTLAALQAFEAEPASPRALTGLRELVAREPGLIEARMALALRAQGEVQRALDETLAVLELEPSHTMALSNASLLCRELHRGEQGIELARRIQVINPKDPRGYRLELVQRVDAEQPEEVIRVAEAGLRVAPEDPQILYLYGLALVFTGRDDEGVRALEGARKAGSRAGDIQLYLGMAHDHAGRIEEALAAYRAYSGAHPEDLRADAAAAWMLYQHQDCARAAPFLVNLVKRGHGRDARIREAYQVCVGE